MATAHHQILIIGGGSAGISVAARLGRRGYTDIGVVEPSGKHYYQPLWTLVGGGQAKASSSVRSERSVMPKQATWIEKAAESVDPEANTVTCTDGSTYEYDVLVVCPGIQLDWNEMDGLDATLGRNGVSSNYRFDLAPTMWDMIRSTTHGTAVFTMPSGATKCAGAPQKIAYLACDHWRREGVLADIDVHLVVPTPRIFGIPAIADNLDRVIADYGINLHVQSEVTSIDPDGRKVMVSAVGEHGADTVLPYDVVHVVPRQSAPDWIKASPLSTGEGPGYVSVDERTLQHTRYPNVFALGDAGSTPNSKTGAAVRKQAPVVAEHVDAVIKGEALSGEYSGYSSCPIVVSNKAMLLAEFDYDLELEPSFPTWMFDPVKPHRAYWQLKKYGLPFMYWNLMLKGLA